MVEKVADPRRVKKADTEPEVSAVNFEQAGYTTALMRALTWYHAENDRKTAAMFIRSYIKAKRPADLRVFDSCKGFMSPTYGYMARLVMRGAELAPHHLENLNASITEFLDKEKTVVEVVEPKPQTAKPNIQAAMDAKIREYIGTLEGAVDDYVSEGTEFSLEADLRAKEIPQAYVPKIQEWARKNLQQWIEILEGKDEQLNEAYAHYGKVARKNVAKFFGAMVEDCQKYGAFKKANRKPRPKKVKPPTVQVAKLQYLKEFPELGLVSVNPVEIIGASQVWIYNTKNKRVSLYRTESGAGLQCKGTRLQNYDPEICDQRTLRKPGPMTQEILQAGKVQLRKFMESLSTKSSTPNGIVNGECVILRVVK
jgi:hypothetical protein